MMSYNGPSPFYDFVANPLLSDLKDTWEVARKFDPLGPHPMDGMGQEAKEQLTRRLPVFGPRLYEELFAKRRARRENALQRGTVTKVLRKVEKEF
jgi:hypothetical protein